MVALSRLRSVKLATPAAAPTVRVPLRVASGLPVPLVTATVTAPLNVVTVFPRLSWAATCTAGAMMLPAAAPLGCTTNTSRLGAPSVTLNAALAALPSPAAVAVNV